MPARRLIADTPEQFVAGRLAEYVRDVTALPDAPHLVAPALVHKPDMRSWFVSGDRYELLRRHADHLGEVMDHVDTSLPKFKELPPLLQTASLRAKEEIATYRRLIAEVRGAADEMYTASGDAATAARATFDKAYPALQEFLGGRISAVYAALAKATTWEAVFREYWAIPAVAVMVGGILLYPADSKQAA